MIGAGNSGADGAVHWPLQSRSVSLWLCHGDVGMLHPPAQVRAPRITKIQGFLSRLSTLMRLGRVDTWES